MPHRSLKAMKEFSYSNAVGVHLFSLLANLRLQLDFINHEMSKARANSGQRGNGARNAGKKSVHWREAARILHFCMPGFAAVQFSA